jgi:hypothetical protein
MCGYHDRARLVQYANVREGLGYVRQVYRDRRVPGRELKGAIIQYTKEFS